MAETKTYEKFPVWIPLLSRLLAILIYVIGAWIQGMNHCSPRPGAVAFYASASMVVNKVRQRQ